MPAIIARRDKKMLTLREMNRLALKRIFDKKNMSYEEESWLDQGIEFWPKKADLTPDERKILKIIIAALIGDEQGKFKDAKETLKRAELDYRQVYGKDL